VADLHLDQEIRIDNQRCAAIIIKEKKLLMMHRIKDGYEYYVFVGGHRQEGEEGEATLKREIMEESSLTVKNIKLVFEFKDYARDNYDFYYLCEWESGEPKLGGEEEMKNSKENSYSLEWIDIEEFETLNILPAFAKHWVIDVVVEDLKK
jgi:8-oxo-dGTP pyrophosphatase MutT (NUDIX family)